MNIETLITAQWVATDPKGDVGLFPSTLLTLQESETFEDDSGSRQEDRPSRPAEVPFGSQARLVEVPIFQTTTEDGSVERFVSKSYQELAPVVAVYRQRVGETLCIHVITSDDEVTTLDAIFELEKKFYRQLEGERLDFQVFPGSELESLVPSLATLVWRR